MLTYNLLTISFYPHDILTFFAYIDIKSLLIFELPYLKLNFTKI